MAQTFFPLACLLLVLTVQHSVRADLTELLQELNDAKSELESSPGTSLGTIVSLLIAAQSDLEIQLDSLRSSMMEETKNVQLDLQTIISEVDYAEEHFQFALNYGLKSDQGSTFVRWGKKFCPTNTSLVYTGVTAGRHKSEKGGGTNPLCLTLNPEFDDENLGLHTTLHVAEFKVPGSSQEVLPCSVCRASQPATIMIAATSSCPENWTEQYSGMIATSHDTHYPSQYICVDGEAEPITPGTVTLGEFKLYPTRTICSSMPCPNFKSHKTTMCVVCSN